MTLAEEDALSEVVDIGAHIDNDIEKSVGDNSNSTVWRQIGIFWPQLGLQVVITCCSCQTKTPGPVVPLAMFEYLNEFLIILERYYQL